LIRLKNRRESSRMLLQTQTVNVAAKAAAKDAGRKAVPKHPAKPSFTMQRLLRQAVWGSTAAMALLMAVVAGQTETGSQRANAVLSLLHPTPLMPPQQAARPFDAEAASKQLAQAVRGLAEDRDRLKARLAAVEHNLDDMTGSIKSEIEAAKAAAPSWPSEQAPSPATPAAMAAVAAPVVPAPSGISTPVPVPPSPLTAEPAPVTAESQAAPPAAPAVEYGVDLGGGQSVTTLRVRWAAILANHPAVFADMVPMVAVRERSRRTELRLVVGPITSAEAAARFCATLSPLRLACRPSLYEGQRLAMK
jgi:hypothetical protein